MSISQASLPEPEPPREPAPALGTELAALLRAGCSIEITPDAGAYGAIYADVVVTPPGHSNLPLAGDELDAARMGEAPTRPLVNRLNVVYEMWSLAAWLREARRRVERKSS